MQIKSNLHHKEQEKNKYKLTKTETNHCIDNEDEQNQREQHQEQVFQGEWIQQPDPDSKNAKRNEIDD